MVEVVKWQFAIASPLSCTAFDQERKNVRGDLWGFFAKHVLHVSGGVPNRGDLTFFKNNLQTHIGYRYSLDTISDMYWTCIHPYLC